MSVYIMKHVFSMFISTVAFVGAMLVGWYLIEIVRRTRLCSTETSIGYDIAVLITSLCTINITFSIYSWLQKNATTTYAIVLVSASVLELLCFVMLGASGVLRIVFPGK